MLGETDPVTRRMSNTAKRRNLGSKRRSLEEREGVLDVINKQQNQRKVCEVLGRGEPIRSQEGALGSDLTELLDRGSRSQRLETRKPHGVT